MLGAGGMGEVYRARDPLLKREVAIKVLPSFVSRDAEQLRRFEYEAQATAALNHPNIVGVYTFGAFEGAPYLVSELLEGETLRQQLRRGALPARKAIEYAVQIARGLAAAHEKGIVHRDLKPENVFVTNDGRVKILDFGIAKFIAGQREPGEDGMEMTHAGTASGVVMGTAGYMAPEQVRGKTLDHRADIFSFGAILYEMLTGKRAFHRSTSVETMAAILNEHPTEISQVMQTIPPGLQRVAHRCLEKNAEQRFQSASDLAFALEALTESGSSAAYPSGAVARGEGSGRTSTWPAAWRGRWQRAWLSGGLLLACMAGAAYLYVSRHARVPFEHFSIQKAMDSTHVRMTAISPDGMYLVSVVEDPNRAESLMVRQLSTNTERAILKDANFKDYSSVTFSPDGSYIYFRVDALGNPPPDRVDVYRISVLGGAPERVLNSVDEPPSFIAGTQRVCFYRENAAAGTYQFLSASAEGGDEKALASGKAPFPEVAVCDRPGRLGVIEDELGKVEVIDFNSGEKRTLISMATHGGYLTDPRWDPESRGLFAIVRREPTFVGQLIYLSYPAGIIHPITNDLSSYGGISLTADAHTLATRQTDSNGRFAVLNLGNPAHAEEHGPDGLRHFSWLDNGTILAADAMSALRVVDLETDETSSLHAAKEHWFIEPAVCGPDTLVAVGGTIDNSTMHIYRMNRDGSQATQITAGPYDVYPQCTPDGKELFFADNHDPEHPVIKHAAMSGDAAKAQTATAGLRYSLSGDGALMSVVHHGQLQILSTATLEKPLTVPMPPDFFRSSAISGDDKSVYFPTMAGPDTTIWKRGLEGGEPVKIASLPGKTVQWMRLSPDGTKLGLILEAPQSQAVLLRDAR